MVLDIKKIVIRVLFICFWIVILYLFLWSPYVSQFFITQKSLNIYTFPQLIDANYVQRFEKETGIKLNISYYENNDELLVKMEKTGGQGFDIVIPSDYAVEKLKNRGLLKKLDKTKLEFLHRIDKKFLGNYFDSENNYSVPYSWETYKIGYNKKFYKDKKIEPSWNLLFEKSYAPHCVIMANNAREVVLLAALYLFGSIDNLDAEKIKKIKKLLIRQKEWVEVYTDMRCDYLLASETCPVAVGSSGEIWKATIHDKDLGFLIPKEGTFLLIDSIAVSAQSSKDSSIYKLINFLYQKEVMSHHVNEYSLFPTIKDADVTEYCKKSMAQVWEQAGKLEFFRSVLSDEQLNEIWIELKTK